MRGRPRLGRRTLPGAPQVGDVMSLLVEPRAEDVHVVDGCLVVLDRLEVPAERTVDVEG